MPMRPRLGFSLVSLDIVMVAIFPLTASAQSKRYNYVLSRTMLDSTATASVVSVNYYNGLGDLSETVVQTGDNGETSATLVEYDGARRPYRSWAPVPAGASVDYLDEKSVQNASSTFYDDSNGYSVTEYDPYDREVSSLMPGKEWHAGNKRGRHSYGCNTNGDGVLWYTAPIGTSLLKLNSTAYYPAGALDKETFTDADSHTVVTFTDMYGQKVLERRNDGHRNLDTYFVYDDAGQLRYVLPPEYQDDNDLRAFAYEYQYDSNGDMVRKILPGCGPVDIWYDRNGKVAMLQDALLKERNLYRCYLYDSNGRMAVQAICKGNGTVPASRVANTYIGSARVSDINGNTYRLPAGFPDRNAYIEIVNFYDTYNFQTDGNEDLDDDGDDDGGWQYDSAVGLLTGMIVATSSGQLLHKTFLYDRKGQVKERRITYPSGISLTAVSEYTFTGQKRKEAVSLDMGQHRMLDYVATSSFNDFNGKRKATVLSLSLNGGQTARNGIMLDSCIYDALGRTAQICRSGKVGDVSIEYDVHGWTKSISTPSFNEKLFYADSPSPCYNGSIGRQQWYRQSAAKQQTQLIVLPDTYDFTYDGCGRMTKASYTSRMTKAGSASMTTPNYSEIIDEYSPNGAIKRLRRYGKTTSFGETAVKDSIGSLRPPIFNGLSVVRSSKAITAYGLTDNLTITLNGNQIEKVVDAAGELQYAGSFDFRDDDNSEYVEYTYNGNGALTSDRNRGIANIDYDNLNNPTRIQFTDGSVTEYLYTAEGEKLMVTHTTAAPGISVAMGSTHHLTQNEILSTDSISYIGDLRICNGIPDMLRFGGGYISLRDKSTANPVIALHYYNYDHLGNVRDVVSEDGTVEQANDYYPFGATYGNGSSEDIQPYKYCGKELDRMYGLDTYDHGARQNYSILGVWDRIDPMAEKYYWISPYAVCGDNPLLYYDPNGKEKLIFLKPSEIRQNGEGQTFSNNSLITYALNYNEDPSTIHIFAHGLTQSISLDGTTTGPQEIHSLEDAQKCSFANSPKVITSISSNLKEEFDNLMNENSNLWKNSNDKKLIVVLHCCFTGDPNDPDNIARELSKCFPNTTFVAPNGSVRVDTSGEESYIDNKDENNNKINPGWYQYQKGETKRVDDENAQPYSK